VKIKKLKIKGFKNLTGENGCFTLDFTDKDGITVLIGNNGSGKSNIIEAISSIFTGLYKIGTPQRKPIFEYVLEYTLNDADEYKLSLTISRNGDKIYNFIKNGNNIAVGTFKANPSQYLPSSIVAIYSGEEIRLWEDYYKHLYNDFMREVKGNFGTLTNPKLIYINKYYWNISLLSLLYSELPSNQDFCKQILNLNNLDDIRVLVKFNTTNISNFEDNSIVSFVKSLNIDEVSEKELSINELRNNQLISSEKDLFLKLMASVMDKMSKYKLIENITIKHNSNLTIESLSEGEKKQILIRTGLEIAADNNSLVLFDEPDANIHVANKGQIKDMLDEYNSRENILTTHSPTLTHKFDDKHIVMLNNGKIEDKSKQEIFSHITNGIWNYQEQSIFLSSTKDIILLVEGKHDKIHIKEAFKRLENEYEGLNFDIFSTDGSINLKQLVVGFSTTDYDFSDKKIIAIFDDDDEGRNGRSKKNFDIQRDNPIAKLNSNEKFYGVLLPKRDGFDKECTIENMYDADKYKEAMNQVFSRRLNNEDFFENKSIDTISSKIKEDAKNQLANNCKGFDDNDFKHFKKLFDLILEIKRQDNGNT